MGKHRNGALSPRREKFSVEMAITDNAAEAARRAGYGEKYAAQEGSRLMRDPKVVKRIEAVKATALDEKNVDVQWIVDHLVHTILTAQSETAVVAALGKLCVWRGMNGVYFGDNTPQRDLAKIIELLTDNRPELRAALLALIPDETGVDLAEGDFDLANVEPIKGGGNPA